MFRASKVLLSVLIFCAFVRPHAQGVAEANDIVENRLKSITAQVLREYNLQREPGYYIPALSVGFRFGGEALFNGERENPNVPVFSFYIDMRFMRFTQGFALARLIVDTPLGVAENPRGSAEINILNSRTALSAGIGGGFSFLDTRLGNGGIGHVTTVTFLATGGTRLDIPGVPSGTSSLFGGAEINLRYQYYFHRYASIVAGFDAGLRFGATSTVTYGFSLGLAF